MPTYRAHVHRWLATAVLVLGGCALPALVVPRARAPFHPTAPAVRGAPLYFYPPRDSSPSRDGARPPRALVFFFGSDVGFWRAHELLAESLSAEGYAVVGCDARRLVGGMPNGPTRAALLLARVDSLVAASRVALGVPDAPLVLAGHSIGGELAVWAAAQLRATGREPGLVGVVSLSPGRRGHLRTGFSDLLGREPHGNDSFAVAEEVAQLTPALRVALVRGERDSFRRADAAIVGAGARRFGVPGQGHSLLTVASAAPVVLAALAYVTGSP